jgi:hypothetical protein
MNQEIEHRQMSKPGTGVIEVALVNDGGCDFEVKEQ